MMRLALSQQLHNGYSSFHHHRLHLFGHSVAAAAASSFWDDVDATKWRGGLWLWVLLIKGIIIIIIAIPSHPSSPPSVHQH